MPKPAFPVRVHIGERNWASAGCGRRDRGFTVNLPWSERDLWSAYAELLPSKRHRAVGKETG